MGLLIIKASAGSGKTFRLATEYLKLILQPQSEFFSSGYFAHILAITFTNEATAEMKNRILEELKILSEHPSRSQHLPLFSTSLSEEEVARRATLTLDAILHQFDRFAISTIDKFFQTLVRNILHEANVQGNFEIELDFASLVDKAVDARLANLTPMDPLYKWVDLLRQEKMKEGKNFQFKGELTALKGQLESKPGYSDRTEEDLLKIQRMFLWMGHQKKEIEEQFVQQSNRARAILDELTIEVKSFVKNRLLNGNPFAKLQDYLSGSSQFVALFEAEDSEAGAKMFLTQANQRKVGLEDLGRLRSLWVLGKEMYEGLLHIRTFYWTLEALLDNYFSFAVLSYLEESVNEYSRKEKILTLSQSNRIIREKIGAEDSPFLYEKIGQRFQHLFVDEFQDTSEIQFKNLKPLLEESMATDQLNLVVGDVKQSIYRWREGDWRLLHRALENNFPGQVRLDPLNKSYRSCPEIVEFNNSLFPHLSVALSNRLSHALQGAQANPEDFPDLAAIEEVYKDLRQENVKKHHGYVELFHLAEWDSKAERNQEQMALERMRNCIDECLSLGYAQKEIMILVREGKEAGKVADYLLSSNPEGNVYRIASKDSLVISNSSAIGLLVSYLQAIADNNVLISLVEMLHFSHLLGCHELNLVEWAYEGTDSQREEKLWSRLEELFKGCRQLKNKAGSWALIDLVNEAISVLGLGKPEFVNHQSYLLKFQDTVQEYSEKQDQGLNGFLEFWKDKAKDIALQMSHAADALRLMTIHASKGLQSPVVIFPFLDLEFNSKDKQIIWAPIEQGAFRERGGEAFEAMGPFPIAMKNNTVNTFFKKGYLQEQVLSYLDNLNLLYVAFTRAEDRLYLILPKEGKENEDKVNPLKTGIHEVLPGLLEGALSLHFQKEDLEVEEGKLRIYSIGDKTAIPGRLQRSSAVSTNGDAEGEERNSKTYHLDRLYLNRRRLSIKSDGLPIYLSTEQKGSSSMERGLLTHRILEDIVDYRDVSQAIQGMVLRGLLPAHQRDQWRDTLEDLLSKEDIAPFFKQGLRVINEQGILPVQGKIQRPDRVIIDNGKAIIIDYKTGEQRKRYEEQVRSYAGLLKEMGYSEVEGYLLYTDQKKLEAVAL
jgi:ATP-dependent exoDNAse (exonuclease V) beta subunit